MDTVHSQLFSYKKCIKRKFDCFLWLKAAEIFPQKGDTRNFGNHGTLLKNLEKVVKNVKHINKLFCIQVDLVWILFIFSSFRKWIKRKLEFFIFGVESSWLILYRTLITGNSVKTKPRNKSSPQFLLNYAFPIDLNIF